MLKSTFNIHYDVAAIVIFIVVGFIYKKQDFAKDRLHKVFTVLMVLMSFTALADIWSIGTLWGNNLQHYEIANSLYYLGQQWCAFIFMLYVLTPLERRECFKNSLKIIISVPIYAISFLIITNWKTHLLFYFEGDTYKYGPLQWICYVPVAFYYLSSIIYVSIHKKIYNQHLKNAVYNSFLIILVSIIIQILDPSLLLHSFAMALSMLQMLIITITVMGKVDDATGYYDKNSFWLEISKCIYNRLDYSVITVKIADYEILINTYGTENFNALRTQVLNRLSTVISTKDKFIVDDNMFSFIINDKQNTNDLQQKFEAILKEKYLVNDIDISFSFFIAEMKYGRDFKDLDALQAILIYYQKMHRMRYGIIPVDEFKMTDIKHEKDIERAIKKAISDHSFEIYLQPIYNCFTHKFSSAEALIRLNKSEMGVLRPDEFIPVAEKSGLMLDIGKIVVNEVYRFISENDLDALGVDCIEVNLSTVQCLQRDFIQSIKSAEKKWNVKSSRICFEITETASNCAPEIFQYNLEELHNMGYQLAIDDFGTGYSNLQRLFSITFDIVKFDKDTTENVCIEKVIRRNAKKLTSAIQGMNIKIVAEGVESEEQLSFLSSIGIDYIQGYYFSKPLPIDDYLKFITDKNR